MIIVLNYFVKKCLVTNFNTASVAVGTPAVLLRSVGLAAKAFTIGSDPYIPLIFASDVQPTNFISSINGIIGAVLNRGNAQTVIDIKNATQSQSGDNKEYLKLSYDKKSEMLLSNVKAKFYSETAIKQLKKETFIQVF